jgi:hypothetical protein
LYSLKRSTSHSRQRLLVALRPLPLGAQDVVEPAAVGNAGEPVQRGQVLELRIGAFQLFLALAQAAERLVALLPAHVSGGVVAQPRQQFEPVRQLDQVVVGAHREPVHLELGVLARRQHDHRHVAQQVVLAVGADHLEAVGARHHQVLQDHGRAQRARRLVRAAGVGDVVQFDVGLPGQHAPDRFDDDELVVDQQDAHAGRGGVCRVVQVCAVGMHRWRGSHELEGGSGSGNCSAQYRVDVT